ncbi:hypothetical protein SLA2020_352270 [Shorea laevis]
MDSKLIFLLLLLFLVLPNKLSCSSNTQTWVRAGYWMAEAELSATDVNSALFTHLLCGFAYVNSTTYQLKINSSEEPSFSTFSGIVRRRNPSITTLLSIWAGRTEAPTFAGLVDQSSKRKSFIDSSIKTARDYGFDGLNLFGVMPGSSTNMTNLGTLLEEWREAVASESSTSGKSPLLLVMCTHRVPSLDSVSYPVESMNRNLDWVHILTFDYYVPTVDNYTAAHAALYAPPGTANTDESIKEWLNGGFSASKLVLGLPYHGFAWELADPDHDSGFGSRASGPAITMDGSIGYKIIKSIGANPVYNSTYVVNYFKVGSNWINFDDVEAIKAKVSYAKAKGLLGYFVFQLSNDYNWVLSQAAAQGNGRDRFIKKHLWVIIVVIVVIVIFLIGAFLYYLEMRIFKSKGIMFVVKRTLSKLRANNSADADVDNANNPPNLQVFSFARIKAATNNFSSNNKLGEGGFGPVYKGKLQKGQDIAVKRLSKTSNQGLEEFKNEVTLTAELQHVNLVRVLGICTEREEKMLVYEYMPNGSLDFYLFDPIRRNLLDWEKRVHIIEGVTQGLLYLQEYSNFTIIHRDLKASNILLDGDMNAKISDFGVARLFKKDAPEANTSRIVGTYGYVPPEYVKKGIYSMKYDVYSFGVLLLQIISGKRTSNYYGCNENLNLLEYAYELWKEDRGIEFFDPSLDDSFSSCKLLRCMQVALLCVQENSGDRPSMLEVSTMLKNEVLRINAPKQPAFSINKDGNEENQSLSRETLLSVNDATITQMVPR